MVTYVARVCDTAMPEVTHAMGASTSIRRTITPLKYTEVTPYTITYR